MTAPLAIDPGTHGDATSTGSTKLNDFSEQSKSDPAKSKSGEALDKLRKDGGEKADETSEKLDKVTKGIRDVETADADTAGNVGAATVGAAPATTGGGGGAGPMSFNPAASMIPQMMQTAAPMAAQMPMMMAQPAASTMYALSPAQQSALLASSGGGGGAGAAAGTGRSTPFAGVAGGSGYGAMAQKLAAQNIPYSWGGGTLEGPSKGISDGGGAADANGDYNKEGFDCSSLVRYMIHQETGVEIPRTSEAQYAASRDVSDPKPGDLVFPRSSFGGGGPGHVQMYLGGNQVIHAPQSGDVVRIDTLPSDAIIRRPEGIN
jgi:cell wall-associated NlpC family hydrolase